MQGSRVLYVNIQCPITEGTPMKNKIGIFLEKSAQIFQKI